MRSGPAIAQYAAVFGEDSASKFNKKVVHQKHLEASALQQCALEWRPLLHHQKAQQRQAAGHKVWLPENRLN